MVRGGRSFTSRIYDAISTLKLPYYKFRIKSLFREEIQWWTDFMSHFNGYAHILHHHAPSVTVYSDASSSGFGAMYLHNWYVGAFDNDLSTELFNLTSHHWTSPPPSPDTLHINLKEMWAVLTGTHRWAHSWCDLLVTIITDSSVVKSAINLGKSKNATIMAWIKEIFWISCFKFIQCKFHLAQIL